MSKIVCKLKTAYSGLFLCPKTGVNVGWEVIILEKTRECLLPQK